MKSFNEIKLYASKVMVFELKTIHYWLEEHDQQDVLE